MSAHPTQANQATHQRAHRATWDRLSVTRQAINRELQVLIWVATRRNRAGPRKCQVPPPTIAGNTSPGCAVRPAGCSKAVTENSGGPGGAGIVHTATPMSSAAYTAIASTTGRTRFREKLVLG